MFPLPEGWQPPTAFEDVIEVGGVDVHRAGVSAVDPAGEEICGSAADRSSPALARAWFELLERACVVEALRGAHGHYATFDADGRARTPLARGEVFPESNEPERWTYARSNGVALHSDWTTACRRAYWELAERDRILRSWRGEVVPLRIAFEGPTATSGYEWIACALPAPEGSFSADAEVVAVVGFPAAADLPLAIGFAAHASRAEAVANAAREALQQLAFLWGEAIPTELPSKPSAFLHLDAFQMPERRTILRSWLEGSRERGAAIPPAPPPPAEGDAWKPQEVCFVDLGAPWLPAGLRVARAICKGAIPLAFGDCPPLRNLPSHLRLHPIS